MTAKYFFVHYQCKIGGQLYRPSICYPIPNESIRKVVTDMASRGAAQMFEEEVIMISGKTYPVIKQTQPGAALAPSPSSANTSPAVSVLLSGGAPYPRQVRRK